MTGNQTLHRFRIVRLSGELQTKFALPEVICADPDGMPFPEGDAFRAWLVEENGCVSTTADNYLKSLLKLLTFLWFSEPSLRYTAPTSQVRNRIRDYLRERLGCTLRPHRQGNLLVAAPTTVTKPTVRLWLVALRRFYECAILKGWYTDANPLVWAKGLALRELEFTPAMPSRSGMTIPVEKQGRIPEIYFCVVADTWVPHIIDDPELRDRILPAFAHPRDQLLARILFESGARVGEVLALTVGDWRSLLGKRHGARATNKGSLGERVKEIWWASATSRLIHRYADEERRCHDRLGRGLVDLHDHEPLFISKNGAAYTYGAFRYHWTRACEKAAVRVTPHQARHWFVTMALRRIASVPDEDMRQAYRQSLIAYMGWRNPETIKAYDHHLHLLDFSPIHEAVNKLVVGEDRISAARIVEVNPNEESYALPAQIWAHMEELLDKG